jgi:hypothetical protein
MITPIVLASLMAPSIGLDESSIHPIDLPAIARLAILLFLLFGDLSHYNGCFKVGLIFIKEAVRLIGDCNSPRRSLSVEG